MGTAVQQEPPSRKKLGQGAATLPRSLRVPRLRGQNQEHSGPRPSPTPARRVRRSSHRLAGGSSTFLLKMNYFLGLGTSAQDATSPPSAQRTERETAAPGEAGGMRPQPQEGGATLVQQKYHWFYLHPTVFGGKCERNLQNRRSWSSSPRSGTSKPLGQTWGSAPCLESAKSECWWVIRKTQRREPSLGCGCIGDTPPRAVSST